MSLFFAESGLLAIGGIVMGLIVTCKILVTLPPYMVSILATLGLPGFTLGHWIYGNLVPGDAISLVTVAFIVTLLAALYPAILLAGWNRSTRCGAVRNKH